MDVSTKAGEDGPAFGREIKLDPEAAAVGRARDFVRAHLRALGLQGERIEDAALVASELVTNALGAAPQSPVVVIVRLDNGDPLLEVRDCSPELPQRREQDDPLAEGGRGLPIVDALCKEWAWVRYAGGKAVIAKLPR